MEARTIAMHMDASSIAMHGTLGAAHEDFSPPQCVNSCGVNARLAFTETKADEWIDTAETLKAKVAILADMIRRSKQCLAFTGAGISVAAGISDYATKSTSTSRSVTEAGRPKIRDWKKAKPTYAHHVMASMHRAGYLKHWLQQNHDSLPQKAGYPQHALNEIHGSLHDPSNPVVPYEGSLRDDLYDWMMDWKEKADLCLALGTSLSGFNCDSVPERIAKKGLYGEGLGLVLVNLQQTTYDELCTLRIFAKIDDVMALLAEELELKHDMAGCMEHIHVPVAEAGSEVEPDVFRVPFDEDGNLSKTKETLWDLRVGARVRLTSGPYEGDEGEVVAKNEDGHYRLKFSDSVHPMFRGQPEKSGIKRAPFSMWLGNWWVQEATQGVTNSPAGLLPFVNIPCQAIGDTCNTTNVT